MEIVHEDRRKPDQRRFIDQNRALIPGRNNQPAEGSHKARPGPAHKPEGSAAGRASRAELSSLASGWCEPAVVVFSARAPSSFLAGLTAHRSPGRFAVGEGHNFTVNGWSLCDVIIRPWFSFRQRADACGFLRTRRATDGHRSPDSHHLGPPLAASGLVGKL